MDIKSFIESLGDKREVLVKKAVQCHNAEELFALAKEYGVPLSEAGAAELCVLMQAKIGKLSDDELDSVAGGEECKVETQICPHCKGPNVVPKGAKNYRCRGCGQIV